MLYNSIYPININYSKPNSYRKSDSNNSPAQSATDSNKQNNTFPNGTKVAIDYSKGQINISQVLTDFRSTIIAINAPDEVRSEVSTYLDLVEKESKKENPSRDIILANLKIASKISDNYIASSLKKPSNVVEGWIDALFLQKINLKANPDEINPDFLLEFPKNAQQRIDDNLAQQNAKAPQKAEIAPEQPVQSSEIKVEKVATEAVVPIVQEPIEEDIEVESNLDLSAPTSLASAPIEVQTASVGSYAPQNEYDKQAKQILAQAKALPTTNSGDTQALNLLNEALGILSAGKDANENIKAAIHFERGKIFDSYDYVDYALRDYFEATKASEYNLKAQAYFKSGSIYDEFNEYAPALDGYLSSVAYSGEADNAKAQAVVLSKIAALYTKQLDDQNTLDYSSLAGEAAISTNDDKLIASTYSKSASNLQFLGKNEDALKNFRTAIQAFSRTEESELDMAENYSKAAEVMRKLGNFAKANKLQAKAQIYYQKAQRNNDLLEEVS